MKSKPLLVKLPKNNNMRVIRYTDGITVNGLPVTRKQLLNQYLNYSIKFRLTYYKANKNKSFYELIYSLY